MHALTNVVGHPYALMLSPGNVADVKAAPDLLARIGRAQYLLADKGYDTDPLRRSLRQAGEVPVILGRSNRKRRVRYDRERYKARYVIKNVFCQLKDFRRVATCYDKLAANFLSGVALATALAFCLSLSLKPRNVDERVDIGPFINEHNRAEVFAYRMRVASALFASAPAQSVQITPGSAGLTFSPFDAKTQSARIAFASDAGTALSFPGVMRSAVYRNTADTLDFYYHVARTGVGSFAD